MMRLFDLLRSLIRRVVWACIILLVIVASILALFRWRADMREQIQAEQFAPPTGHFVDCSGGKIFVQELGPTAGTPVVFVHGTGAWSETWKPTMKALAAAGYHTIAIDLPPFGYSQRSVDMDFSKAAQAKRIISLLDAMNIKRTILVGHSFGAGPTVEAAMQIPDRVSKLVIVDGALDVHEKNDTVATSMPVFVKVLFEIKPIRDSVVATFVTNPSLTKILLERFVYNKLSVTNEIVEVYQRPMAIKGSTEAVGVWLPELLDPQQSSRSEDAAQYRQLKVPVALIWGRQDSITSLSQGAYVHALVDGSTLSVMDNTGNIPQIEDNNTFNRELLNALKQQSGNARPN